LNTGVVYCKVLDYKIEETRITLDQRRYSMKRLGTTKLRWPPYL